MQLSQKLKEKIKKNLTIALVICALISSTLATFKLADFSMNSDNTMYTTTLAETGDEADSYTTTRLENTDTITYIYDANDLVAFRDAVNAGDSYTGKTVYLMNDIDLSTVCSSTLGSWVPIGYASPYFRGTFDGRYHTISNLYINSNKYQYTGLFAFSMATGVIQNLNMENLNVYNSYNTKSNYVGGIVGYNYGTIQNCSTNGGSISNYHTVIGTSSSVLTSNVGGITSSNSGGTIKNCYNNTKLQVASSTSSSYANGRVGGIVGQAHTSGTIINCYNKASVVAKGYTFSAGGVVGANYDGSVVKNCYNYGSVTGTGNGTKYIGGIVGRNAAGYSGAITTGTISNSYCTTGTTYSYYYYSSSYKKSTSGRTEAATLKTYTVTLGNAFAYDVYGKNSGYPVLAWENETPVMELNKNQEYIKIGQSLQLNVVEKDEITELIGTNYSNSNFKWTSTNEDVATVNENGLVTGISDGYTTIYAYHETTGMYAMSVINVAKDFANPQIETGKGFTTILKSNGTVWTIGNNASGQLGNGSTDNSKVPVQVKIDEDTNLENIVKIASGTDHVIALANDGKVYSWGANGYGQLGQNNTESSNYAKIVLGTDGVSYLNNIVDISASAWGTVVLDKNGNVYVWGHGTYGEMGNNTTTSSNLPIKSSIENVIQVSIGQGQVAALTSDGVVWSWGYNYNGEIGINCTQNTSYPMKVALKVTEVSVGAYHAEIKKVDNTIYSVGCYTNGRLATSSTANQKTYVKATLPNSVTENNKVKYLKAGRMNTSILLQDGTVWSTGNGTSGELGNGTTTNSTSFVQGYTNSGILENVLILGNNNGDSAGSTTTGYGLNTAVITKDGDIYTTGDNSYGQIGDNTETSKSYYTRMGFVYLDYEDKTVEVDNNGYQIDLNKLKYIESAINAYNDQNLILGELKYTSLNEAIAKVDSNGKITPVDGTSGITKVKIEDITNNFETYITIIVNKLENTDTITYIYSPEDLVEFRNSVNAGNTYAGKTVYLMADIDLSTICSETLGSWQPIGNSSTYFAGTFDGNYHTISNLYMNTNKYRYAGLFYINKSTSIIQNLMLEDVNIYNYYNTTHSYTGGIISVNYGTILNCATISGSIKSSETIIGTSTNTIICGAGGIAGSNLGTINSCYNGANVKATSNTKSTYGQSRAGGIAGQSLDKEIINCYNTGNISTGGYYLSTGGIVGVLYRNGKVKNSYNYGTISITGGTYNFTGGILGRNGAGYPGSITIGSVSNSYCTTATTLAYYNFLKETNVTTGRTAAATLKTYTSKLGKAFEEDDYNINSGYPILWWQAPRVELNKKQAYIKIGDGLQLSIVQNDLATGIFGREVQITDFVWTSSNEDIATVNENGLITGVSDGYTTIYGYNETYNIYAMCIVNVATDIANVQIETGTGFTAILKADGTVWTIGNNANGQLGDGTNTEKIEAVQVKTAENAYLNNIVKISVGDSHVLALTKDGKVYAWGANTYGQLGLNNKVDSNYAKLVLGEGGSSNLDRIIDISAGSYGSTAINEFGWMYVWGNGSYGEMGNNTTITNTIPTKATLNNAISTSMGSGHIASISQDGKLYTWGRNTYGELGIGNKTNSTSIMKVVDNVAEVSAAGFETVLEKVDGTLYSAGLNTSGQLGTGTTTNATSFTKVNLPSAVTETNTVKYIKAGKQETAVMLDDSTVWTVGNNTNGELGNGTNTNSVTFVQGKTENSNLENSIIIGRNNGTNVATVNKSGRVFTTGSNTYGQIGDNTKDDTTYFTQMGYIVVDYPEKINLLVNETLSLSENNFSYVEKYFNVYKEDISKVSLVDSAKMLDSNIATYENGVVTAKNIGSTILMVKEDSTKTIIYIPVNVLPANAQVTPSIKTGNNYTVALKSNGTVWTFGTNTNGELGLGDNIYRNIPVQVDILKDKIVEQISVGNNHVMALTTDGEVYTWGLNGNGQLGVGNTKNSNIPQKIAMPESTKLVQVVNDIPVKVIANENTSYVITQDGNVYVWGDGFTANPKLLELENEIIDITNNYALDINGNVYNLETNTRLEIAEKIKYISESSTHTVFLSESGLAYAIGSNTYGQFGDGTNVSNTQGVVAVRNEDLTDVLRNIVNIEAGNGYTTIVLNDGRLLTTGINDNAQLGTNEIDETNTVVENKSVSKLLSQTNENIILMDAGADHIAVTLSNGNSYTWGLGTDGQLGNGTNNSNSQVQLVGKNIVEANTNNLLLNVNETFDLKANTTYFNLLKDINGEISYESKNQSIAIVDAATGEVTAISEGTTVIVAKEVGTENINVIQVRVLPEGIEIEPQVSTNGSHTVTLKIDGTVWSYGNNTNGELGNGTEVYSDQPVQAIFPEGTIIKQVSAGENFSVALDTEGNVWTWGANDYYQLGNNTVSSTNVPTKVEGLSNITKIAAGTYSVLVLNENKELYGWGLNSNGELGIGSYTNKVATPTKAKYITDVIDIAVGKNHSIALKSTGEVYVTGLNIYGQLGNNDTSVKKIETFTKVENLTGIARISATDSGNIVSTVNGNVYTWGLNIYGELGLGDKTNRYSPTLVEELSNIILVDGGKNHSVLLDKNGNVYTSGSSKYGQLGLGINTEESSFTQINSLNEVMTISAGNTYTTVAKKDGTVWAFGDYNHGDKSLKSKTTSLVPMQVGNDTFSLGINKITIKKSQTVNITSHMKYNFNLIYLDKNTTGKITYESLNEEIAIVSEYGEVLGVKEGLTWVKAIEENGKEHVVYVYVTDNESDYAPEISAGEDFASVLKSDGTIWTFGHNNNGELGIGSNKTKDIPEKINVIQSYKEISSGESFTIAIRTDGTVWSFGKNNYGQLGVGSTKNGLNPVQVNGISDIVQIATGKEHSIALDSYGILYGWGRNNNGQLGLSDETILKPTPISYTKGTISSIFAGYNQTIIINTKGEIYGYGSILNGTLEGIENAVKVSVGEGYFIILTTEGKMYKYNGTNLSESTINEQIVDVDSTNNNIIAQTVDGKVYTFTANGNPVLEDMENIYTIAAGVNNSYVIKTDGTVYSRGVNTYGQLGNGTRIDSLTEFTLIGDRNFTVEPKSKIMYVNDVEQLTEEIKGTEFNVFNKSVRNGEEYTWETSDENIVTVDNGTVTAISEGTAQITITDNVTGAEVTVTRVVIPIEKDRIESIKVDNNEASIKEEYEYYVEVETNTDTATLVVKTKDTTDKISIDRTTWYENGTLTLGIDIPNEENEFTIIVETENGTQIPYTLTVKKISTDISLENITVDGISAIATSSTNYEVVVPETTTISEIIARANSQKAQVSINGEIFIPWKSITTVNYENNLQLIVPIVVKAENGDELEYTLTIYKESAILQLESLTVDGKEATRTSEGIYSITIARDLTNVEVTAKAISELVKVSLNSENSEVQISTKQITITDELTEVTIRLSTTVDGVEVYRDYTLNIYKKAESGNIEFVIVNGTVITPNVDGNYETVLTAETMSTTVKVIAQNTEDYVQIAENASEKSSSEVEVETLQDKNQYIIKITDSETNETKEYTLYINKPSVDTTLAKLTVSNGEDIVIANKSTEEENVYIAKVKLFENYTITAITNNINAYVSIADDGKVKSTASKVITKTDDYMEVKIVVESENGDLEEYILKIYIMSSDTSLNFVKVNEIEATLQSDGSYLVNLQTAETKVSVTAETINQQAQVRLEDEDYELQTTTRDVTIDSKDTVTYIYVKAEDGTTKKYKLVISGLPDDSTLHKVYVNGVEAKYIEGENKYEIRSDSTQFNVEAISTDSLATISLGNELPAQGNSITVVQKTGTTTTVRIDVVAQNGIQTTLYTLEIKEKSNDSSIGAVTVNGNLATKLSDGNYEIDVVNSIETAVIKVEANDSFATVYLDEETENSNNITVEKTITDRTTIYTIKVIAEDGTEEEHTLTITRLNANVNIQELTVNLKVEQITEIEDEETGEITEETTIVEKTFIPELQLDGTYYVKIDRGEKVDVKAILEDINASVKISDSQYAISQNEVNVDLVEEKTTVIISVKAEDGTIKEYTLIIEKKSNDTSLKTITSSDMLKLDNYTLYVDETLETIDLSIVTNSTLASLKLNTDSEYTPIQITRIIGITEDDKVVKEEETGWFVDVEVMAEDGTVETHTITILKIGNTNITSVKVNDETVENKDDTYTARVNVANTANVEITPENIGALVQIIQSVGAEDGTVTETVIGSATGTLTVDVPLTENPQNYIIRITSANGSTIYEYDLVIEQKSTDSSISYVKVNNITAIQTEGVYKSVVSGSNTYPVLIKTTDEKAKVKIAYKDYQGDYSVSKLAENVPVEVDEVLEVTITVQSENGDEQEYKLFITRISDDTSLEYVKVNGENCTSFNELTNTYTITIDNNLYQTDVEVKSVDEKATLTIGSVSSVQLLNTIVGVDGEGTTKTLLLKVQAEDGTTKEYNIVIKQLSASIALDKIVVNDIEATRKDANNYEVTISNKDGVANILASSQIETSTVLINGELAGLGSSTKSITLTNQKVIEVPILITAEDGVNFEEYNLTINILDNNKVLEYVKVDGVSVTEFNEDTKTYTITVDNTYANSNIEIKTQSEEAKITIGDTTVTQVFIDTITLQGQGKTTSVNILVTAEDGTTENYILNIKQQSNDTTLDSITVNGANAVPNEETGIYEIELTDEIDTAKVIATAGVNTSTVSIDGEQAQTLSNTKTVDINGHELIEMLIVVTSEDGTVKEYKLHITVLETSNSLEYVKVNTGVIEPEEDGITYKTFIAANSVIANIEIKAESAYANIAVTNKEELSISNESLNEGILTFTVDTPNSVTTINYTVISENGVSKDYSIVLTKISTDNTLKELYVGEELIEVSEDGNYYYQLENPSEITVKAIANNEFANIRIDYNEEEKQETQAIINAQKSSTKVTITITSQSGLTTKYYLFVKVLANNTLLDKVLVDTIEVTNFKEETMTYTSIVDSTKDNYELFLMAVNDNATVELYDGETLVSSGVGNLTEIITLSDTEGSREYKVKVSLSEEYYTDYTLLIMRTSNDTSLKLVEVNDIVRTPTEADKYVYEVGIPKLAETAKIKVQTTNKYAKVKIGDNQEVYSGDTVTVSLNLLDLRTTVPVVVTAVDGTTIDTFNILLIRQSNVVDLESVIVNNSELENVDDVYTYYMQEDEDIANVQISTAVDNNAAIEVDGNEGIGYLEFDEEFGADTIKVEKIIKVTSEDGTVEKEYTLVLIKKTQIIGSVLTKNFEGKYLSNIELYRIEDTTVTDEVDMSNREQVEPILQNLQFVETVTTNEDGTYVIDIEQTGNYIMKVTKPGYLSYLVTNIEIVPGRIVDLGAYELIAGDIVPSGEVEIDDLVTINDSYGIAITDENKESVGSFDLNEDGTIDTLDRNILKANYGKLAECAEWVNLNAVALMTLETDETLGKQSTQENQTQDFILPMLCSYVVTSPYGSRIDPLTGEQSFHCGIDISGIHHTEILSVADGEVTFAGVKNSYGNCIEIKHVVNGETVYSFYAHLSQINVQAGETVKQGQIIGLEGGASTDSNPGDSTGHHLHFEIRKASGYGNDVDPSLYIEF